MKRKQHLFNAVYAAVALALFLPAEKASSQSTAYWIEPIFQYAVFYNINLEIDPGASLPIEGAVFSNGGIWSGTGNVEYTYTVQAVGQVSTNTSDPFCLNKTDTGTPSANFLYPGQPVSGLIPMTFYSGGPSITNAEAILNPPPVSLSAPQTIAYQATNQLYDFNAASLIVSNWYWGTNGVAPWSNNFTVYAQDNLLVPFAFRNNGVMTNWVQLTNDYYIISNRDGLTGTLWPIPTNRVPNFHFTNNWSGITWTNWNAAYGPIGTNSVWYAGFSFLTNVTFYDFREKTTVRAVQLDIGKFGAWITNATVNGGSNWNQELCQDDYHGFNSIYIYNAVPFIGQQQLPAVRVMDGQLLPSSTCNIVGNPVFTSGLTVVTPQPLYVWGNYNVQTNGGPVVLESHNVNNTYPAALMADAITVLSVNWSDSYNASTSIGSRLAANTTINTACLEGIVPSSGANYSGGLENFFRFDENWSASIPLTYNGSMTAMFASQYATNVWPGTGTVYNPPSRNWAFDTNFLIEADLPPLTPTLVNPNDVSAIITQPTNQTVIAGSTVTFSVTVTNLPPGTFYYLWRFNGTNTSGDSNTLVLTNVSAASAGDYSVVIVCYDADSPMISSNAVLSVYPSAVPAMSQISYSSANGLQFNVAGVPGFNYIIQTSTNLLDWVPLTTNNSPFAFTDTNIYCPQRFYRSVYSP